MPTLQWDPASTDNKEVLVVARIGTLMSGYEPNFWFESFLSNKTIAVTAQLCIVAAHKPFGPPHHLMAQGMDRSAA